jgi:hypothetical protein
MTITSSSRSGQHSPELGEEQKGLSSYAEATLGRLLGMSVVAVAPVRAGLNRLRLIAHRWPLYQLLSLAPAPPPLTPGLRPVDRAPSPVAANGARIGEWLG